MKQASGQARSEVSDMQRIPMTPRGYEIVVAELRRHKEVLRPENVKAIEEARAHGDISENAEFDAAKERQAQLEGRIIELEHRVAAAEVIDVTKIPASDRVIFGTTVRLLDIDTEEELTYRIVSEEEADARDGLITPTSPIGGSLLGRSAGDEVRVKTPRGMREFEILEVEYI
jgi:transcription elongation factor GreA